MKRNRVIAKAMIKHVLPALTESVMRAGEQAANKLYGDPDVFEVEQTQQAILYALADLLTICRAHHEHIHPHMRLELSEGETRSYDMDMREL